MVSFNRCAGVCSYEGRGGLCSIRLSVPLLKLRPRKDLVETLLVRMTEQASGTMFTQYWKDYCVVVDYLFVCLMNVINFLEMQSDWFASSVLYVNLSSFTQVSGNTDISIS